MYREIARNKRWSILLIALFCVAVIALGLFASWVFAELWPLVLLVIACPLYVWQALSHATKSAAETAGVRFVSLEEERRLHRIVETTAIRAGIPMPRIGVIDEDAPNAFAASLKPDDAVLAVTRGALELLDGSELEAVVAHEVAHIVNQDGRVTLTAFALVGSIVSLAAALLMLGWAMIRSVIPEFKFGLGLINGAIGLLLLLLGAAAGIVGFLIGPLITSAVSRRREFLADASGVELTRFPDGLVRALTKIEERGGMLARPVPEVAELFIVDPTGPSWFDRLLRSHPPTSERVERLEAMAREF
ncbi:M48 family metalloprotease [Yonghaparkia sp. Root332]|uniref:M48 family metalloprotease n=1 Tax=Yonghaparkia sp. Root332 TaxID=1736516 RepID=UPI0006FC9AE2|nr:M48 family metalloprotease [Yonghaparkia sp. Root332]KQV24829.1 hypothetical protein ASC54_10040 [Yonghaparkia sp. Root332]